MIALLRLHLAAMHAHTPPGRVHALDLSGLTAPGIAVDAAWRGETRQGFAALKVRAGLRPLGTGTPAPLAPRPAST